MKAGWRILAAVLAAALGFSYADVAPHDPVSRCLVIGYDDFAVMPDTAPCSANNTEIMTALFLDFVPDMRTVVRRVNGPGTADALETLVRDTFSDARPGDTSYLYLSTHGVTWEEDGETRTALMISDGTNEETLEPARLRVVLDGIPGKKVLILDACHSGAVLDEFAGTDYLVLASCAAAEDSYFWFADNAEESGTGYFTTALESALRASHPDQIDPDGNGGISLGEIRDRIAALYGASQVQSSPENREQVIFRLPEERVTRERILGLTFDPVIREEDSLILPFHFEVAEETRLEYRIVPKTDGRWDFHHFATMPDRERTGTVRGLLSPGSKDRKIRISAENLGAEGEALLQIISLRGLHGQIPVLEGTWVISEQWSAVSDQ